MKIEEVLKLTDAGFTADEIRAMMSEPAPEPIPEKEPEEISAEEPEETPAPKSEPDNTAILRSLEDQIAKLTKAVQANNRLYAEKTPETEVKAEDILATLIKGKEKKI